MRISDWSSDVCSSDLWRGQNHLDGSPHRRAARRRRQFANRRSRDSEKDGSRAFLVGVRAAGTGVLSDTQRCRESATVLATDAGGHARYAGSGDRDRRSCRTSAQTRRGLVGWAQTPPRSEENTSELQSLMRISYAVFCLKKKK